MTSSTRPRALVVGGTGPTGISIVHGLVGRGYDVTILHRGTHEREETPAVVEHLHAGPVRRGADPCCARRPHVRRDRRDVRTAAPARRDHGGPHRSVRLGGRRARATAGGRTRGSSTRRGYRFQSARTPRRCDEPGERREGVPHRPHRGGRVRAPSGRRALPLSVRVRSVPARAARVVDRATHPRRTAPDHRRRRRPHAAPSRLHRELRGTRCCSGWTDPTPPPGRSSTSADEEVLTVRQVVDSRARPRSGTSSTSSRCRTSSRSRPGRCSRSRCRPIACST